MGDDHHKHLQSSEKMTPDYRNHVENTRTENDDVSEWSIVYFESDKDEIDEGFNDLIPSSWITAGGVGWYPIKETKGKIQKSVKRCENPNYHDWNCFSIKEIENGIGNFCNDIIYFTMVSTIFAIIYQMIFFSQKTMSRA